MSHRRATGMTAAAFLAQLEADPQYQAEKRARDAVAERDLAAIREAEAPVLTELKAAGVDVESVWDLVNTSDPYPAALPILARNFFRGGFPERITEGLGRALAVGPALEYWDRVRDMYLQPRNAIESETTAMILAASATEDQFGDLIELVLGGATNPNRIYLLEALIRTGGREGRLVVARLTDDPQVGEEARRITRVRHQR